MDDPCLICPNALQHRLTRMGRKFCVYCQIRTFLLTQLPAVDNTNIVGETELRIKNPMQMQRNDVSKGIKCSKCGNYYFYVYVDDVKVTIVCCNCGVTRLENPLKLLRNPLQHWTTSTATCPKCQHSTFSARKETKIHTKEDLFDGTPATRIALLCVFCGAHYLPEDLLKGEAT